MSFRFLAPFGHLNEDIISEVDDNEELRCRKNELFEIRQKIYAKLRNGKNTFLIMKMFKRKVERFLKDFRAELSYVEDKNWRDMVLITEKAVMRNEKEPKVAKHARKDKILAPPVRKVFDAVRAQELVLENLPEPPLDDEIEQKLERLKKFNKKPQIKKCEGKKKAKKVKVKVHYEH